MPFTKLLGALGEAALPCYNEPVRAFLAIRLSPASVEPLIAAQKHLERAAPEIYKWSSLDAIHLTLYFLGETEQPTLESLRTRLQLLEFPQFELGWGGLVTLPSPDVPKILAVGACGNVDALRALQRKVHDICYPVAENKETRAYFPHATIGRLKRGIPPSAKVVKRALSGFAVLNGPLETVTGFELIQSYLSPEGSSYETLATFPLEPEA
jgi:2'-5' RNA ligase